MRLTSLRCRVCLLLLVAGIGGFLQLSTSFAQQPQEPLIRQGDFQGLWAANRVIFSIQEVHDQEYFDGIAEIVDGTFRGVKFGIHGRVGKDLSLVMTRHIAGDVQMARSGPPNIFGGRATWSAETRGLGIQEGRSFPFQLTIPLRR